MKKLMYLQIFILLSLLFFGAACNDPVNKGKPLREQDTAQAPWMGDVKCMMEDKAGNIWFGSNGKGLFRYDGHSFKQFTTLDGLISNKVYCLLEDKEGKIWIGTEAGLCLYQGKTFETITIPAPADLPKNKNVYYQNHWIFNMIQDKSGQIWLATIDGVYIYNGQTFTHFKMPEEAHGFLSDNGKAERIFEDKDGNIWLGCRAQEGVYKYDGKTFTHYKLPVLTQGHDGPRPKQHQWAWPQMQDKNGHIWYSNWGGVYRYDGKTFTPYSFQEGLKVIRVTNVLEDKHGKLWIYGNRLHLYDGTSFTLRLAKADFANLDGWTALQDSKGNLWLTTKDKGVYVNSGSGFDTYAEYKRTHQASE